MNALEVLSEIDLNNETLLNINDLDSKSLSKKIDDLTKVRIS